MSSPSSAFLLDHFDRLAEAPGGIAKLRALILDLAVQGKLVERDPKDESASELLTRIKAEKERRGRAGTLGKQERLPAVRTDEEWFSIPTSWVWTRLGTITEVLMGQSPPGATYNKTGEGIPLINGPVEFTAGPFGKTVINQYTTAPTNLCEEGDLLLCVRGSTTGRTNIAGFHACIGRGVAAIRPFFADEYVRLFIWRLRSSIIAMGRGIAFPSVTRKQIAELPVPLPPLAEQRRIVAKVAELMGLCDALEAAQQEREAVRARLRTSALHQLASLEFGIRDSKLQISGPAAFVLQHLLLFSATHEDLTPLRESVLQLAIQGKLGTQNADDEPAAKLLERIRAAGSQSGVKDKSATSVAEPSFEIPANWIWTMAASVFTTVSDQGKKVQTNTVLHEGRFPVVDQGKVLVRGFCNDENRVIHVSSPVVVFGDHTREVKFIDFDFVVGADGVKVLAPLLIEPRYFYLVLTWIPIESRGYGRHFKLLRESSIPLPPLAEQRRIVAKVDELMAVLDALEATLTTARTTAESLLAATVARLHAA